MSKIREIIDKYKKTVWYGVFNQKEDNVISEVEFNKLEKELRKNVK